MKVEIFSSIFFIVISLRARFFDVFHNELYGKYLKYGYSGMFYEIISKELAISNNFKLIMLSFSKINHFKCFLFLILLVLH